MSTPVPKRHVLTVALEDYFQVGAFNRVIQRGQWYRFETRLQRNAQRTLELLDRHDVKATFFVLGWIADRFPELVREVAERGHEIASKGYYHRNIRGMTPAEFRDDLLRSREALEHACGKTVLGYRMADGWFQPEDLWALDILAETGYRYDSSIAPLGRTWAAEPFRRFVHTIERPDGTRLHELPISTSSIFGFHVPVAGGNYLRQLPHLFIRRAIARWDRLQDAPLVAYFHVWEMDPEQPTISASTWLQRIRHYRNLHKMEGYIDELLRTYRFTSAADYLGLTTEPAAAGPRRFACEVPPDRPPVPPAVVDKTRTPVSIVVPCFNEELILPYLANTLASVEERLRQHYAVTFILVDDGSRDGTWKGLQGLFGGRANYELYRHEHNRGVAAAILTGIQRARTEIVCSIDCDCTYDPHELEHMIPLLEPGVDLVTASPYHPEGGVRNVPGWRLRLSKSASWLYRRVLHHKLYTYTSCFRVYRRSAVAGLELTRSNFLGVAELLGRLDLQGSRIVEYPAILEVRMLGRSKMKTIRTILGHLRLMLSLARARLGGARHTPDPEPAPCNEENAVAS